MGCIYVIYKARSVEEEKHKEILRNIEVLCYKDLVGVYFRDKYISYS
jgi:hypothetical protein